MYRNNLVRRLAHASGALVLSAAIAGCGGQDTADEASQTRTVEDANGAEVTVPADIDSVVVLEGRRDADIVLALGLPLVGYPARDVADGYELLGPLAEELAAADAEGAEALFLVDEINLEAIAETAPAIIVSRTTEIEPILPELEAIAPVVALGNQDETTWQQDLLSVAEATDTVERAEKLIDAYDAQVEMIKTTYAEQIASTPIVAFEYDDEGTDVGGQRLESLVMQDLGVRPSQTMAEALASDETLEFSYEQTLSAYEDAGAIYTFVTSAAWWAQLNDNPLWNALPAVQEGHVVRGDRLTHDGGPLTAMHILDQLEELYATI